MNLEPCPPPSDEREILVLAAYAVRAARHAEGKVGRRTGDLPRDIRQADWLTAPLLRLEEELKFAPWDDLHCLLRETLHVGFLYLEGRYTNCPMRLVRLVERELQVAGLTEAVA
jgi:hypothetical protein